MPRRLLFPFAVLLLVVAATPVAAHAVDATTPLTVGDRAFTLDEIVAAGKAGADAYGPPDDAWIRLTGAQRLVAREWHVRQAAERGVAVAPTTLDTAVAAETRHAGGAAGYAEYLTALGLTAEQRRAQLADALLAEAIAVDVVRKRGTGPVAFGRAFHALAQRQRAVTTCLEPVVGDLRGACGNLTPRDGRCTAIGFEDLCPIRPDARVRWYVPGDVVSAFVDPERLEEADSFTVDESIGRIRRYLAAHHSTAFRRCENDPDEWAYFDCDRRADAIAVAWAIARIHVTVSRRWTIPATGGLLR